MKKGRFFKIIEEPPRLLGIIRRHLRINRGLRRAFGGLLVSGLGGVALTFSKSPAEIRLFSALMLGGIGFLVWSMQAESKHKGQTT
jgi:hypothetical protein